jgi:hypothetical protein
VIFTLAAILPAAFSVGLPSTVIQARTPFGAHSPPGNVPIFLLQSALLI